MGQIFGFYFSFILNDLNNKKEFYVISFYFTYFISFINLNTTLYRQMAKRQPRQLLAIS